MSFVSSVIDSIMEDMDVDLGPYRSVVAQCALVAFGQVAVLKHRSFGPKRRPAKGRRAKRARFYALQKRDERGWRKFNPLILASLKET